MVLGIWTKRTDQDQDLGGEGGVCVARSEHKYYILKSETYFNQLTLNVNAESSIITALSEQRLSNARRSV